MACLIGVFLVGGVGGCAKKGAQHFAPMGSIFRQDRYEKLLERQEAGIPPELDAAKKLPAMTDADVERIGDGYYTEGKLEMAFLQYSKVLRKNPQNVRVLVKRGMIFLKRGLNESAMKDFQAVLEKKPDHAVAHQGMGQAFFQMKNHTEAERHFLKAVRADPGLWVSHNYLGILYDYQQLHEKALEHYTAALRARQDDASLYNNLGVSYALMGEDGKAVEAFRKGLSLSPRDRRIGNNLGMLLCKLGRDMEALEAFKTSGDEAQAYNNLGCVYLEDGQLEKAVQAFERAIQLRREPYAQASDNLRKAEMALQSGRGTADSPSRKSILPAARGDSSGNPESMHIEIQEAPPAIPTAP